MASKKTARKKSTALSTSSSSVDLETLEVTERDHFQRVGPEVSFANNLGTEADKGSSNSSSSVWNKLTGSMGSRPKASIRRRVAATSSEKDSDADQEHYSASASVGGGGCGASVTSRYTYASNDTVKASNKTEFVPPTTEERSETTAVQTNEASKRKSRWGKFKLILGVSRPSDRRKISSSATVPGTPDSGARTSNISSANSTSGLLGGVHSTRQHALSADFAHKSNQSTAARQRLHSAGDPYASVIRDRTNNHQQKRARSIPLVPRTTSSTESSSGLMALPNPQDVLDQTIRGRLDAVDVISLGPAYRFSVRNKQVRSRSLFEWADLPSYTFTGKPLYYSPADMISHMLWGSTGRQVPEVVLEGLLPGADERWTVRVEEIEDPRNGSTYSVGVGSATPFCACPTRSPSTMLHQINESTDDEDDGSPPSVPPHKLWPQLWGTDRRPPLSASTAAAVRSDVNDIYSISDDPLLHLAAEHSIPIDLDEGTFCVSERAHLETIQSLVESCVSRNRMLEAILILTKLVTGIEFLEGDSRILKGATFHNIGVLYMWHGDFIKALDHLHLAVQERSKCLPKDHPDTIVSLVRRGQAQVALGRLDDALLSMELALAKTDAVVKRSNDETVPSPSQPSSSTTSTLVRAKVMQNIGVIQYLQSDFTQSLESLSASVETQRLWLDCSSPTPRDVMIYDASITLGNMAKIYFDRKEYDFAYYLYEEALLLQTTTMRSDHELVLDSLTNLALCRSRQKGPQQRKALQFLQGCLRSKNGRFGKDSPESVETLGFLAFVYQALDCHDDALKCLKAVSRWQQVNLPAHHPIARKIAESIVAAEEHVETTETSTAAGASSIWI